MRPVPPALETFLAGYSSTVGTLALRARELILKELPEATETVWIGWKVVGYGTGPGMPEMVYGIAPLKHRINISFANGTLLDDPHGLLKGASKTGRHLHVSSIDELESLPVRSLIKQAMALHRDAQNGARSRSRATGRTRAREDTSRVRSLPAKHGAAAAALAHDADTPVSDETVLAKTGRSWAEWFALLDDAGARRLSHPQIVKLLAQHGVGPWWRQMLTVGYERARGLREKHETISGYQVGASRTIAVPLETLWMAWSDARRRRSWLGDVKLNIRKATKPKSMRITWDDGSHVDVLFTAKSPEKSAVSIDHRRLPDRNRVEEMRAFWKDRLDALRKKLER